MKQRASSRNISRSRASSQDPRNHIIDWLRDAYAMERGLEKALKKQAENEDLSSEIRHQAAMHLHETERHAQEVEAALKSLDANVSSAKTSLGIFAQKTKGLATKLASDERIKDLLDAYAMEHMEIACYSALAAAAYRAGYTEVAEACERIIPDEERMAQTLREAIPDEVTDFLFEGDLVT